MLRNHLEKLLGGNNLSREEACEAMDLIMTGQAAETQIAAFLGALRLKGETVSELTGFAETMRRHAVMLPHHSADLVDTCGTGGDQKATFNVSTTVAFVLAGGGVKVAKHGNRGVSSPCGSADVLEALGLRLDLAPEMIANSIENFNLGFMFAPQFHPAMGKVAKLRRELATRTVFNQLGPLTNPARAPRQLLGVYSAALTKKLAEVLAELGTVHAMVVHSRDGMDEISSLAPTLIAEVKDGRIKEYELNPLDYGFSGGKASYAGGSAVENAALISDLLNGKSGPERDIVLLNAAAGFIVGGKAEDFSQGLALAKLSIESGAARGVLETLRDFCRQAGECSA